jgi:hypothetical protein
MISLLTAMNLWCACVHIETKNKVEGVSLAGPWSRFLGLVSQMRRIKSQITNPKSETVFGCATFDFVVVDLMVVDFLSPYYYDCL